MSWWGVGTAIGSTIHKSIDADKASKEEAKEARRAEARAAAPLAPYRQFGEEQLGEMQNWLTSTGGQFQAPTMEEVTASPGYASRLGAVESSAAARGSLFSGNALRNIGEFGSDEYGREYNRKQTEYQNQLNQYLNFANLGYGAAGGTSGIAQNLGQRLTDIQQRRGAAQNQAIGDVGSSISGGIGQQQGQTNWNSFLDRIGSNKTNSQNNSWDDGNDYDSDIGW